MKACRHLLAGAEHAMGFGLRWICSTAFRLTDGLLAAMNIRCLVIDTRGMGTGTLGLVGVG